MLRITLRCADERAACLSCTTQAYKPKPDRPSRLRAEPAQRRGDEPCRFLASVSIALLGSASPL
jgi:hypothetical protein